MKEVVFTENMLAAKAEKLFNYVDNYATLSSCIGVPPRILSYVRKFKTEHRMQSLVVVKDRKTYKSSKQLSAVQRAIKDNICQKIFTSIQGTNHILAYKKGFDYRKELQDCVNNSLQISFDIKQCYDSITFKHIVDMLQYYGFTHRGAKLVAGYCVVERRLRNNKIINTLQQGSQCSPIISNLVLNLILDEPIQLWISNYIAQSKLNITYKYYRYSDNVVLFIQGGSVPLEFLKDYKAMYRSLLNTKNIFVHDEFTTPNNHPFRNQRFLGIVLNKIARIEQREFKKIRAILFNCCRNGLAQEARKYLETKLYNLSCNAEIPYEESDIIEKFCSILTGKISYIKNINEKQYLQLRRLLDTAKYLAQHPALYTELMQPNVFEFIKKYRFLEKYPDNFIQVLEHITKGGILDANGNMPVTESESEATEPPKKVRKTRKKSSSGCEQLSA